ncbi:MAG: glycoside hydrolase family 2, partial [Bacteroidales bacterium]|nr:glycoside hydrolase family 2 [Bacteroidales bacterium]
KKIGFREIEIAGNQVFLNGSPIKLRGVNRHEAHPLLGRSLNKDLWLKDALLFKQANVNYIRTSHYPPAEEFIAFCDSIGLYVELENPLCWVGHGANAKWQKSAPHDPEFYPYLEQVSRESIGLLGNHSSILIWSMANESTWGANWAKLLEFYNKKDPSRPVSFHDQAFGGYNNFGSKATQIANIHYPGLDGPSKADTFSRPLLFGEYSHLNTYNREEIATDPGVRDSWGKGIKTISNSMFVSRGCLGGAIWSGIDDIFFLPDGRAVGYGEWGPIDGWRRKKPEYYHMKKAYSPVIIHNTHPDSPMKGQPLLLQIENRFDFTNLNECKIEWDMEGEEGSIKMDLSPKNSGIMKIYPKTDTEGKTMHIRFYSPPGYLVDETTISVGKIKREDYPYKRVSADHFLLDSTQQKYIIKSNRITWEFDRSKGILISASLDQQSILSGNTELMMLPLNTGPCATEHSLDIPVLNNKCIDWKLEYIYARQSGDTITLSISGKYFEASGRIQYAFMPSGLVKISYRFKSNIRINPRQWGLVLDLNKEFKNMEWSRKGIWTQYPEDHIGRTHGKAVPFVSGEYQKPAFGKEPENKWYHDANQLGSNDFRSTKDNIYWTALTNNSGKGLVINGKGTQATRTWQAGTDINLLVTGFNTGGGDLFFSGYYKNERRPIKEGDGLSGSIELFMIEKK